METQTACGLCRGLSEIGLLKVMVSIEAREIF